VKNLITELIRQTKEGLKEKKKELEEMLEEKKADLLDLKNQ